MGNDLAQWPSRPARSSARIMRLPARFGPPAFLNSNVGRISSRGEPLSQPSVSPRESRATAPCSPPVVRTHIVLSTVAIAVFMSGLLHRLQAPDLCGGDRRRDYTTPRILSPCAAGRGPGRDFHECCARIVPLNPPPAPPRRGATPAGQFPSWEGSGVGWLAEGSWAGVP